jgi:hypothetical protein
MAGEVVGKNKRLTREIQYCIGHEQFVNSILIVVLGQNLKDSYVNWNSNAEDYKCQSIHNDGMFCLHQWRLLNFDEMES